MFSAVSDAFEAAGVEIDMKQLTNIPNSTVDLDVDAARKVLKLMESLDDHDDVQNVSANFNIRMRSWRWSEVGARWNVERESRVALAEPLGAVQGNDV